MTSYSINYTAAPTRYSIHFAKGTGPQGPSGGGGGGGGSLTVREVDGSPSVTATELVFANGRLSVSGTVVTVAASNTIHSGTGAPANSLGIDGDYYFDAADAFFYGPKVAGAWADEYVIMSGAPGAAAEVTSTSSSIVAIGTGSKTFTIPTAANRGWIVGMRLRAAFDSNNYVEGPITALAASTVTINADLAVGSGTRTSWSIGIAGDRGATGAAGSTGGTGAAGAAATITVGTVTTGAAGTSVNITNSGSSSAAVFNFTIPRGDPGTTGAAGSNGLNADMTRSSTTSNTIGLGSSTFAYTSSGNLGWVVGMRLRATSGSNWEEGAITAVSSTSVTINVDLISGSGTLASWTIGVAGERGAAGSGGSGSSDTPLHYDAITANHLTRNGSGTNSSQTAIVANRRYYVPVYVPVSKTYTQISVNVITAAASSSIRMGIKNCNQATGQPTTLIVDAGEVSSATTGTKTITGLSAALTPGWYVLEFTSNGAPSIGSGNSDASFGMEFLAGGSAFVSTLTRDVTYGTLAADDTANTMGRNSTAYIVGIR